MPAAWRRSRSTVDIWPGWVDALSTLLIIIIFILLVFVLGQFFLGQALFGRERDVSDLNRTVTELGDMLSLERKARSELEENLSRLSGQLRAANDELSVLAQLRIDKRTLEGELADRTTEVEQLSASLADANAQIATSRDEIQMKIEQMALLENQVKGLEALKAQLEKQVIEKDSSLADQEAMTAEAQAQTALMAQQLEDLKFELDRLSAALNASDRLTEAEKAQISDLGRRMNRALAAKVQELQRYRSEFFGRLRDILGTRPGVTVSGDRFVFQSEVLFASGSAEIGDEGRAQLAQLATTLLNISRQIPDDVDWILRIDGHTDDIPISTAAFPSNWELSTARAVAVVKLLNAQGIPADRLAAAGFGEFQPIDNSGTSSARARNRRIEIKLDRR